MNIVNTLEQRHLVWKTLNFEWQSFFFIFSQISIGKDIYRISLTKL